MSDIEVLVSSADVSVVAAGSVGPQGPQGDPGPAGPQGPAGADGAGAVDSVNGQTGTVVLTATDVGADASGAAAAAQAAAEAASDPVGTAAGLISDTVYGAGWNADTTHAPSKNAVYDKIETLGTGVTNLGYTPSPTDGTVTSDTGTDATVPLADGTNAGLLTPAEKTKLSNTSGTNTGDQDLSTYYHSGGTDVPVADGGTGASTAAGALTNLGAASAGFAIAMAVALG